MKTIIACKIFADELEAVLSSDNMEAQMLWIDVALHTDPPRLEKVLRESLSNLGKTDGRPVVLFGGKCLPEIDALLKRYGAVRLSSGNCIEAFVGREKQALEKDHTMIMTPGWVRAWPEIMRALGWEEADVRISLGRYDRILLLEPGIRPLQDEEILSFFDLVQVPVEIEPLDLDPFRVSLHHLLEQ